MKQLILALALALGGCAATTPQPPASVAAPMPERIHPPEQDLAYVRGYAAANGFTYTPWLEDLSLLQEFHWRAEREVVPGYVSIWADEPRLLIDVKPPFDRATLLARLAPELRNKVVIREVRYSKAESDALEAEMARTLSAIGNPESISGFMRPNDRMEVTLTSEADAAKLRAAMSPALAAATHITIGRPPLIVF